MASTFAIKKLLTTALCCALTLGAFAALSGEVRAARPERESNAQKLMREDHWRTLKKMWKYVDEKKYAEGKLNLNHKVFDDLNRSEDEGRAINKLIQEQQIEQIQNIQIQNRNCYGWGGWQKAKLALSPDAAKEFQDLFGEMLKSQDGLQNWGEGFEYLYAILYAQLDRSGLPTLHLVDGQLVPYAEMGTNINAEQINVQWKQIRNIQDVQLPQARNFCKSSYYQFEQDPMQMYIVYAKSENYISDTLCQQMASLQASNFSLDDTEAYLNTFMYSLKTGLINKILFTPGEKSRASFDCVYFHDSREGEKLLAAEVEKLEKILDAHSEKQNISQEIRDRIKKTCKEAGEDLQNILAFGESLK